MQVTRKITLSPQGNKEEVNRVYEYLRDGMEVQSQMMNMYMSALYAARLRKASSEELKELRYLYSHVPTSAKGSAYDFDMAKYPTGLPIAGSIPNMCKPKFDKACKDGLLYGKVSLPSFKKTMPLFVHNAYINLYGTKRPNGLYHEYENPGELAEAIMHDNKPKIHIKFANNIIFDILFGAIYQSQELRTTVLRIFEGDYKVCDSSIGFDRKTGKKIILYLSLKIPDKKNNLDESTVVGVDLGLAIPAMCALNNDIYKREKIGDYKDCTKKRLKMQKEKNSIKASLAYAAGGHGRNKKLAYLEKIRTNERNFVQTYNHMVSKKVVDFALKYRAKYINIEDLSGFSEEDRSSFVLRNWSSYELQQMITYKAAKEGIEVRKIYPAYTSQTCSICGQKGIRSSQSEFKCSDPNCKSHTLYKKPINADFNGARNIAMSEHFATKDTKDIMIRTIEGNEYLEADQEYKHCYLNKNNLSILCSDNLWHNFKVKDIIEIVDSKSKKKLEKKSDKKK